MKKTKKATEPAKVLNIKCTTCGRETPHYVNVKGEVRCSICQTVAKKVAVKTPKEVEFEMDEALDTALNPIEIIEEVEETEKIEVPAEVGPEFDDDDLL